MGLATDLEKETGITVVWSCGFYMFFLLEDGYYLLFTKYFIGWFTWNYDRSVGNTQYEKMSLNVNEAKSFQIF